MPARAPAGLALVTAALLAACAAPDGARYARTSAVSVVALERALARTGSDARIYVQNGAIVRQQNRNRFEPYCSFGLRKRGADEHLIDTIEPDRFLASEPSEWAQAASSPPGMRGVSAVGGWFAARRERGTPGSWSWYTEYGLRSDAQPQVDTLTCAYDGDALDGFLTLDQIRGTLAGVASLRTGGQS